MNVFQLLLALVLLILAINFIIYAAKHELVKVIKKEDDFVLRYPRVHLWLSIVFFLLVFTIIATMIIYRQVAAYKIVLICVLCGVGMPFLLHALVWKIKVFAEYIIYTSMFGIKKQVYYKDIKKVIVTKYVFSMYTTLKTFQFNANVIYKEDFLIRLRDNGVKIDRY
ncbi:MAG: DUF6560 family protein [Christensenellaceae bacterium]